MRILLLGEFSGFYNNLKDGLIGLGNEVDLISSGDGWKAIGGSSYKIFSNYENKYVRFLESMYLQNKNLDRLSNYDIVQFVQPNIFGVQFNRNIRIMKKLKENNSKLFLSVAGSHYYVYKTTLNLRYSYFEESAKGSKLAKVKYRNNNEDVLDIVDGIIPITYTYAEAYRLHEKLLKTIPLPLNVDKIKFIPQKVDGGRLKIFHGLNREEEKGTRYIRKAMLRLKENYPNDVEILIDGRMPLDKYLKVLEESNIVVDQALSYEYGMNAVYSMAMGKVVLSGNEPECQQEFGRTDIPVINILPSADDIYNKLEKLVLDKKSIVEIGEKSRIFVEDFHNHVKVAKQYVDTWNSVEVKKQ